MATYLYRKDCLEGRVFNTDDDVKKAVADGWVDAPEKAKEVLHVNKQPAAQHEKPKDK